MNDHCSTPPTAPEQQASTRDVGMVTAVEMMYLLLFLLVTLAFFGFVGRLHAAGVHVSNTAQSAARAASLSADSSAAGWAAQQAVDVSTLPQNCSVQPLTELSWEPSATGEWQGGSVTVTVSCQLDNAGLAGLWSPGTRTVSVSDTQPIDRYKR